MCVGIRGVLDLTKNLLILLPHRHRIVVTCVQGVLRFCMSRVGVPWPKTDPPGQGSDRYLRGEWEDPWSWNVEILPLLKLCNIWARALHYPSLDSATQTLRFSRWFLRSLSSSRFRGTKMKSGSLFKYLIYFVTEERQADQKSCSCWESGMEGEAKVLSPPCRDNWSSFRIHHILISKTFSQR